VIESSAIRTGADNRLINTINHELTIDLDMLFISCFEN